MMCQKIFWPDLSWKMWTEIPELTLQRYELKTVMLSHILLKLDEQFLNITVETALFVRHLVCPDIPRILLPFTHGSPASASGAGDTDSYLESVNHVSATETQSEYSASMVIMIWSIVTPLSFVSTTTAQFPYPECPTTDASSHHRPLPKLIKYSLVTTMESSSSHPVDSPREGARATSSTFGQLLGPDGRFAVPITDASTLERYREAALARNNVALQRLPEDLPQNFAERKTEAERFYAAFVGFEAGRDYDKDEQACKGLGYGEQGELRFKLADLEIKAWDLQFACQNASEGICTISEMEQSDFPKYEEFMTHKDRVNQVERTCLEHKKAVINLLTRPDYLKRLPWNPTAEVKRIITNEKSAAAQRARATAAPKRARAAQEADDGNGDKGLGGGQSSRGAGTSTKHVRRGPGRGIGSDRHRSSGRRSGGNSSRGVQANDEAQAHNGDERPDNMEVSRPEPARPVNYRAPVLAASAIPRSHNHGVWSQYPLVQHQPYGYGGYALQHAPYPQHQFGVTYGQGRYTFPQPTYSQQQLGAPSIPTPSSDHQNREMMPEHINWTGRPNLPDDEEHRQN
ncbi:hypothetical protein F5Y18DRAFT_440924 [Xylariaceae sp. FL1019]|nr:hypothetical protein F5Y18DRAFT_440924 [Xylariaceae sp. FL1019]